VAEDIKGDGPAPAGKSDPNAEAPAWAVTQPLAPGVLRRRCDARDFSLVAAGEPPELAGLVGQERAVDAIRLGIAMRKEGFNVFALGPGGTGKHTLIQELLERQAREEPPPPDWCYVNNFADSRRPKCLKLPTGRAAPLRDAMIRLVSELRVALPAAFEREEYRARREVIDQQFKHRHEEAFSGLQQRAEKKGIGLLRTPVGLALAPIHNGKVIAPDAFQDLPEGDRARIAADMELLQGELEAIIRHIPEW
jgi:hypothetical protein